jgi:hypothetical protein
MNSRLFSAALLLCVFVAEAVGAPSFVKVGNVYSFSLVGSAPYIASVIKDEGEGWLKISMVETQKELWINLAQVQAVERIDVNAEVLRSNMQRMSAKARDSRIQSAILNNLRQIEAAVDQYRIENGKEPRSLSDIVGPEKFIKSLNPVGGEDYSVLKLSGTGPFSVKTKDGLEVSYER